MDAITNPNPANYITSGLGFGTERRDVERGRASLGATAIMDSEFGRIKIRERKTWSAVRESYACRKIIISEDRAHHKWSALASARAPLSASLLLC